ncbi:peptidoglycan-binding domain-containing protein [Paracoccus aeridis]|uniref:peptidoglycan-binding domain-containing protein n=1 Tax=Paracoccus aeridis TaxID=1966466 RepID=UPI0010AB2DCE|nr:peptidoglycan-binding domain-containing protein [Paracoccus aeridis]
MVGLKLGISAALASAVLLSSPAAQAQNLEDILGTVVQGLTAQQAAEQERALWDAAQRRNTVTAYRSYLDDYPNGRYAATARERIASATGQPVERRDEPTTGRTGPSEAERLEASLRLSSTERRQIQRDLNTLGYNTNGTDGTFGRGTRAAITAWQRANKLQPTTYLNADQVNLLRRQANDAGTSGGGGTTTDRASSSSSSELALNLSRNDRVKIQQQLTNLGYDTNGADGLFGSGTRRAIGNWQQANRFTRSGYLNAAQLATLREQAGTRTAPRPGNDEVEEQLLSLNRSERIEVQRALTRLGYSTNGTDGVFGSGTRNALGRWQGANGWPATGFLNGDQYRTLRNQGNRVTDTGSGTGSSTSRSDEAAWQRATSAKTLAGYQAYLDAYPNGAHADEADRIIARTLDQYADAESELLPEPTVRRLVENRLKELGYNTGTVDGNFTSSTRNALREYQRRNNLTVTGYATQQTLLKMLGTL